MKKYYPEDVEFVCDFCENKFKEVNELHYTIESDKLPDYWYLFCSKRCLEKFVEKYKRKKYPKSKNF